MVCTPTHPCRSRHQLVARSRCQSPVSRCRRGENLKRSFDRNSQYSITALTDSSGTVVERYAYTAYGTPSITDPSGTTRTTTAVGNRYTYTGRERDETLALYHYRARMYDPVGGRFVSRDPIGYTFTERLLYHYVQSNPTRKIDPSGLHWQINNPLGEQGNEDFGPKKEWTETDSYMTSICVLVVETVWEPAGWPDTVIETIKSPCSPSTYVGLLPLIPNVRSVKRCLNRADDNVTSHKNPPDFPTDKGPPEGGGNGRGDGNRDRGRCLSECQRMLSLCLDTKLADKDFGDRCGNCWAKCRARCLSPNPRNDWLLDPWKGNSTGTFCKFWKGTKP